MHHIDKIVGVPRREKHQVTTAPVRGTADAQDPEVQKKTLAGHGIVMARAGGTASRTQATTEHDIGRRIRGSQQDPHSCEAHSAQEDV